MSQRRLIVGCGYLGRRVAERWRAEGDEVWAVTRSLSRAETFREQGLSPIVADVTEADSLAKLPVVDSVLYAVGFDRSAEKPMREVYVGGLRNVIEALPAETGRFLYVSSTGVYGQTGDEWIDEDSRNEPERESGRVCLEAERTLTSSPLADRAVVLRMAGIYGPGRVPNRAALESGEPVAVAADGYLNLIHVDDAATVVQAAARKARPSPLYLVADGQPVLRGDYYAEAARLLQAPPPRFVPPDADSPRAQRGGSSKRVDSRRMMRELAPELAHPSYREGLAAILSGG